MWFPAIIAAILVVASLVSAGWTIYALRRWPRAEATILRYHRSRDDEGTFYMPVYRFSTNQGETVTAVSFSGSWRRPWDRGATVKIRYCPTNPRVTEIDCFINNWGITLTLLGLAAIFQAMWAAMVAG